MRLRWMLAASLLAGCGGETVLAPPLGLSHAVAIFDCGPADGSAVTITLSREPTPPDPYWPLPATPYVRITIWHDVNELNGSYLIGSNEPHGFAVLHSSDTFNEIAISGTVSIVSVSEENRIRGSIHAEFPSRGRIQGGFDASWKPVPPGLFLCG